MPLIQQCTSCSVLILAFTTVGCVAPMDFQEIETTEQASDLLRDAMEAHGGRAFTFIRDVNVSYEGQWLNGVGRIQPDLVDESFRKRSEERLIMGAGWAMGQVHRGPGGVKQVFRQNGQTKVYYNRKREKDSVKVDAASAVVDAYAMFLTGPFYFMQQDMPSVMAAPDWVDGRLCDQVLVSMRPGFGAATEDRVLVAIDRQSKLVRRFRFSFEGLKSTRGVVADVVLRGHRTMGGVVWATQFEEILQRPFPLAVHRWRMTGFDVNRDLNVDEINQTRFSKRAAQPARVLSD